MAEKTPTFKIDGQQAIIHQVQTIHPSARDCMEYQKFEIAPGIFVYTLGFDENDAATRLASMTHHEVPLKHISRDGTQTPVNIGE